MKYQCFQGSLIALATAVTCLAAGDTVSEDFYSAIRANDMARLRSLAREGSDINTRDRRGETPLMYAAAAGSLEAMEFLVEKGADVNVQNAFGSTALIWSATDLAKIKLLLAHGANPNTATKRGRTALLVAAMSDGSAGIVRLLIQNGADPKTMDAFRTTALRAAAMGNDTETMRILIKAGVDVNAPDLAGLSPLMMAAGWNGNLQAVQLLLAQGAKVNAVSAPVMGLPSKNGPSEFGKLTALLMSAPFGPPDLIQLLLDSGADVNARDVRNMTPLMLAVATDHQNDSVIRLLLEHGADKEIKSSLGETAPDWARRMSSGPGIKALNIRTGSDRLAPLTAIDMHLDVKEPVERSLSLIEKSSWQFFEKSGCVSCHAQSMTDMAVGLARSKGLRVDENAARERAQMIRTVYPPEPLLERMDPPGAEEQLAYPLAGLALNSYAPDRMTDAFVANIAATQGANGAWHVGAAARPPAEEGDIFRTALCIRALKVYGPPGRAPEMSDRIAKAQRWLKAADAITSEDHTFQLLGLYWSGNPDPHMAKRLTRAILAEQQPDGGWRQHDGLPSDAYATGESLYALAEAGGVSTSSQAYHKGIQFLLKTQHPDGSWFVASRSPRIQAYFDAGFPYGHDQWISSWATAWASMALAEVVQRPVQQALR
jgi:ankyrin repeat protein